jgi:hypothetical protein
VMQAREEPGLAFELLSQAFLSKQRLFQRDCGVETLIDGFVNRTHTALPKLAHDAITTLQDCFRRQHSAIIHEPPGPCLSAANQVCYPHE